jgi:hypothetical protein
VKICVTKIRSNRQGYLLRRKLYQPVILSTNWPMNQLTGQRHQPTNCMEERPCWETNHPPQKFPAFYRTWSLIIDFTRAGHLSIEWVHSLPLHFLNIFLILFSYLWLNLRRGLYPSSFENDGCIFHLSRACYKHSHLIIIDLVTIIFTDE